MSNSVVMAIGIDRKGNSLLLNGIDSSMEIIFAQCLYRVHVVYLQRELKEM